MPKSLENIETVKQIVLENHRITIKEVAQDIDTLIGSCHSIFQNLFGMKRMAAKFILHDHNAIYISILVRDLFAITKSKSTIFTLRLFPIPKTEETNEK